MCRLPHRVCSDDSYEHVINSLENDSIKLLKCFAGNQMISNKDKHHVLISDTENITINVDSNITKKKNEKLSGGNFKHLDNIKKADPKVNALSKILP